MTTSKKTKPNYENRQIFHRLLKCEPCIAHKMNQLFKNLIFDNR